MEEYGHLVNLEHDVGEEELVAVLRLDRLVPVTIPVVLLIIALGFTTAFMQVYPIAKAQVVPLDLSDSFVEERVERWHVQIVDMARTARHEIVTEGNAMRLP